MSNTHLIHSEGQDHWEHRISMRGYPYSMWRRPMPRITDFLLDTVFYVYPSKHAVEMHSEEGGSGFWFVEHSNVVQNESYFYAVTNAHVIHGIDPVLRVNTTDGKIDTIETMEQDWIRHADGDDLAVCHLSLEVDKYNIWALERNAVMNDAFLKEFNVGPGDDIVMPRRFRVHPGRERNLPTLSFGSIAAMNEEPLKNPYTGLKQESYIVEMRSISGFSGSPVIIYIPPVSLRFKQPLGSEERESLRLEFHQRLLGIQWGHIQYTVKGIDAAGEKVWIKMDSAMAGVVPGHKLIELIDDERLAKMRQETEEELQRQIDNADIALDSHETNERQEFTREAFLKALRKVSRPNETGGPPDKGKSETSE